MLNSIDRIAKLSILIIMVTMGCSCITWILEGDMFVYYPPEIHSYLEDCNYKGFSNINLVSNTNPFRSQKVPNFILNISEEWEVQQLETLKEWEAEHFTNSDRQYSLCSEKIENHDYDFSVLVIYINADGAYKVNGTARFYPVICDSIQIICSEEVIINDIIIPAGDNMLNYVELESKDTYHEPCETQVPIMESYYYLYYKELGLPLYTNIKLTVTADAECDDRNELDFCTAFYTETFMLVED